MKLLIGYTLVECLVSILLLAIVLGLAIPGYQYLIASNKTTVGINQLVAAIQYARNEAITRHLPVTLCKSADGHQCDGAWRDGWLVFTDPTYVGQVINDEQILRMFSALPIGDQLFLHASLNKNDYLQFNPTGDSRQSGTFIYCPQNHKEYASAAVISLTGRIRIEKSNFDKTVCG